MEHWILAAQRDIQASLYTPVEGESCWWVCPESLWHWDILTHWNNKAIDTCCVVQWEWGKFHALETFAF